MFLGSFGPVAMLGSPHLTNVEISTVGSSYSTTNGTVFTITNCDLGAADPNRWLAVALGTRGSNFDATTLSALTIGGATYDFIDKQDAIPNAVAIGLFHIPTGLTANVVATWSVNPVDGCGIQVYRFLSQAADPRHVAALSASATNPTGTLDVAAGGAVIAVSSGENTNDPTWTGVTETNAFAVAGADDFMAAARSDDLSGETGRTITATGGIGTTKLVAISVKAS
jgi:hypothetical protein